MPSYPISQQCQLAYPHIPQPNEAFNGLHFQQELRHSLKKNIAPLSLALSMPFCSHSCQCCDHQQIIAADLPSLRDYLSRLMVEIELHSQLVDPHRAVLQLHFAGTPSCFDGAEITELMHCLASNYHLVDDKRREYSIDIHAQKTTPDNLALYKGLGFNHLNFTVSDSSVALRKSVSRSSSFDSIKRLTEAARLYQFSVLTYSVVYGLAGQTISSLMATLDQLMDLSPDRIFFCDALYAYPSCSAEGLYPGHMLSAEEKKSLLALVDKKLSAAAYKPIGIECYVKPSDPLVLAQRRGAVQYSGHGYTACKTMGFSGLGVSSYSALQHSYIQNESDISSYFSRLDNNELPIARGITLPVDERPRRYLACQLVCNHWCDIAEFEQLFSVAFADYFSRELAALASMELEGLIYWRARVLVVASPVRIGLVAICSLLGHAHLGLADTGAVSAEA